MAVRRFLVVLGVALVVANLLLTFGVNADSLAVLLVAATALPITLFVLVYGLTTRWWTFWIGQALMISSTAFALLVDISLLYQWLGDNYQFRDHVRISVYVLVFLGASWKLLAVLVEKVPVWTGRRPRRAGEVGR